MKNIFFTVAVFFSQILFAQTPESLLQEVQQKYTAEKIYIHYDKANYTAGETIWFKAYLMEGILPSTKSTVLCVELINDSGRTEQKKIIPINGSVGAGEFELSKTMRQGSYTVKAFTRTLMNFGSQRFYYKAIQIYNPTYNTVIEGEQNSSSIYFLPESGNLITDLNNKIAFKCTDRNGYPLPVEGNIVNGAGKFQANFKSSFDGMGTFELTPKLGEQYFAECIINKTEKRNVPLPASIQQGVALKIFNSEGKTFFNVDASKVVDEILRPDYILGVQENFVVFKTSLNNGKKIINGEIPLEQLPTGILQLTVFNKENKPLAERLSFVNSGDYIPKGNFTTGRKNLQTREKNSFSYNLEDTTAGSFSVSVIEFDSDSNNVDNIVSRFLLTNDLKGTINNPAYYFENNDLEHKQNLDLVMLTNGWRKYSWNEILLNKFPSMSFKDPDYISTTGKVFDPITGKPLANAAITVGVKTKDNLTDFLFTETDNEGNIFLQSMNFEDTASFTFQSKATKRQNVNVILNTPSISSTFYTVKTAIPKSYFELPKEYMKLKIMNEYNFNKITKNSGILLDEVRVASILKSEKEKFEKKYVSGRLGSMAIKEINFLEEPTTSTTNVFDYIRSRINGVTVSGGPLNYFINFRNTRSLQGGPIPMNIFLDEFQVEPSQIATLRIQEVALIKVFGGGGLSGGVGGSLAIYTKKGEGAVSNNVERKSQLIEGFAPVKSFFSPDYEKDYQNDIKSDERTTLYWNPYLITSAQNKSINFSFFNSDKAKKIKIVIEGFLEDGKLLHVEKIID